MNLMKRGLLVLGLIAGSQFANAADWSTTQVDLQIGDLISPGFGFRPETEHSTTIITFQHASGYKYGDNFFFVDFLDSGDPSGFNNKDWYGEWYTNFSYNKIYGKEFKGAIRDVGLTLGVNYAADANVVKYIPAIRLDWNIPGFNFFNTMLGLYIDDSDGVIGGPPGSAPAEDDSWIIDASWGANFGKDKKWSFAGHIEYIDSRTNEFGGKVESWVLAQPQIRYHFNDALAAGIEYQYWMNKLGDKEADESAVQLLLTYTF